MPKVIGGSIKFAAGRVFTGGKSNQPRQSFKAELDDGSEADVWFPEGKQPHASLKKGDRIQLLHRGGDKYELLYDEPEPAAQADASPPAAQANGNGNGTRPLTQAEVYERVKRHAPLMAHIHTQLMTAFESSSGDCCISEQTLATYAVALYNRVTENGQ